MTHEELRHALISLPIIDHTPTQLRSGEMSDYYCDVRRIFGEPSLFSEAAQALYALLPQGTTCLAASGYGGLPLGTAVALIAHLPFIGVRSESKNHGKGGRLCGYLPTKTDRVVLIDDVLTSGSSLRETMAGLVETGAAIAGAIVLVRRKTVDLGLPVQAVFEIEELLR